MALAYAFRPGILSDRSCLSKNTAALSTKCFSAQTACLCVALNFKTWEQVTRLACKCFYNTSPFKAK